MVARDIVLVAAAARTPEVIVRSLAWTDVKCCVTKGIRPENVWRLSGATFLLTPAKRCSDFKLFHQVVVAGTKNEKKETVSHLFGCGSSSAG